MKVAPELEPSAPEGSNASVVLTPQQLAARWQMDVKSIYALIAAGAVPTLAPLVEGLRRPVYRISLAWVALQEQGRVAKGGQ